MWYGNLFSFSFSLGRIDYGTIVFATVAKRLGNVTAITGLPSSV